MKIALKKEDRVVLPMVAGIGNALMAVPLVRQLVLSTAKPRVTVIARIDAMAEPFRRIEGIERVIVSGKSAGKMIRLTRQQRPDIYIVPFPSNRWQYNLIAATSGARVRLMHDYPAGHRAALGFMARAIRVPAEPGLHDVVQNLRLLRPLGIEPDEMETPRFPLNDEDRAGADALLGDARDFVVVHAGSAQTILAQAKRWPAKSYAELMEMISRDLRRPIVLLEGPDEAGVADEIAAQLSGTPQPAIRTVRLRGSLGIGAAVLERAALYVGSDSGLAHLAAAVGTRAVTLFAPADPTRVCPSGNRDLVVQPPCACSPCMTYPWAATKPTIQCREPMCVTRITVAAVMEATQKALADEARR